MNFALNCRDFWNISHPKKKRQNVAHLFVSLLFFFSKFQYFPILAILSLGKYY